MHWYEVSHVYASIFAETLLMVNSCRRELDSLQKFREFYKSIQTYNFNFYNDSVMKYFNAFFKE